MDYSFLGSSLDGAYVVVTIAAVYVPSRHILTRNGTLFMANERRADSGYLLTQSAP